MKIKLLTAAALTLAAVGAAQAQDVISVANNPWEGWFAGANIGGAWNHTCDSWEPGPAITSGSFPVAANRFYNRDCPNNGNFIGGVDGGYNFQIDQWVWGLKADYDAVGSKSKTRSYTYTSGTTGYPIPDGTYTTNGKVSPNGIILLGPRVGYAFDQWLPYFRVGGAFSTGSSNRSISFTPLGATTPAGSISGSKDYKSSGFNVGAGLDYDISGPWSFTAEYNYVNLGKGSNSNVNCASSTGKVPPICT